MGRKGVTKSKPQKSRPFSSADIGGSSNVRSVERSLVQSLLKDKDIPLRRDGVNPSGGSNKTQKKR